VVAHSV